MKKPIFTGACTALVTPFNKNGLVDYPALEKLIEFQISGGISALLLLGTTGEASTLTTAEKKEIVEFACKKINARVPVIVGLGGNNPASIIEFGTWVAGLPEENRIVGALVSSPYYNKATQAGLVAYFHQIASAVALPLIVYNVPARTGQNIEPETFAKICKNRRIAGIKEASGNIAQIAEIIHLCPHTPLYAGDDALALPAYSLGASGVISVLSNICPREVQEIYDLSLAGEDEKTRQFRSAQKLFISLMPLTRALFVEVSPIPVKYALSKAGIIKNYLRAPLTQLTDRNRETIDKLLLRLFSYSIRSI